LFGWVLNRQKLLADAKLLGKWGEKYGRRFLKRRGLRPLAHGFSCKAGEIDLIMAEPDRTIVFIEVKTRADEKFASAETSVTAPKQTRLARTAKYFLAVHKIEDRPCRFDVLTIVLGQKGKPKIKHYKNAFVPLTTP